MEHRQPAVTCLSCSRSWNSASMAEGLALLGACPRCGGELEFHEHGLAASPLGAAAPADASALVPHLVLGIPRR